MTITVRKITAPSVVINGVVVPIKPNSFSYTEGQGAQNMSVQSGGGRSVQAVYGEDVGTFLSDVKFDIESTANNVEISRGWKANNPNNTIRVTDVITGFSRAFRGAAMLNDPEKSLSADGDISIEFKSLPAV